MREIKHNNKVYKVGLVTRARKEAWRDRLVDDALAPMLRQYRQGLITQQEFAASQAEVARQRAAGIYDFYSPLSREKIQTAEGVLLLTTLLLDCTDDEAETLIDQCRAEIEAATAWAILESAPRSMREQILARMSGEPVKQSITEDKAEALDPNSQASS